MWIDVLIAIVVIVCLAGIGSIVARKFPQLTLIDTEALPLERDAKRKKEIIRRRVDYMTGSFGRKLAGFLIRQFEHVQERFRAAYRRLLILERQYRMDKPSTPEGLASKIVQLFEQANAARQVSDFGSAEKRYIEVLSIDRRNHEAYWGLGELYLEAKRYEESKETFAYLVRMIRKESRCAHLETGAVTEKPCEASPTAHSDIATGWFNAGLAAEAGGDIVFARQAFERAVVFGPANPRHLDLLLDACILEGDKSRAAEVFAQLQATNPDNAKLEAFAQRIAELPDPARKKGKVRFVMAPRDDAGDKG